MRGNLFLCGDVVIDEWNVLQRTSSTHARQQ